MSCLERSACALRSGMTRVSILSTVPSHATRACAARVRPGRAVGRRSRRAASRQSGIALVLALWVTVLLTAMAGSFAYSMRTEALAAGNAIGAAKARAAADGAIERTAFELGRPRVPGAWLPNGAAHAWSDGDIAITVSATDESAKIDLNTAGENLLRGLFTAVAGVDPDTAIRLVDALIDWRDTDDFRRPHGAEAADYVAAGSRFAPANAPFETVGEVSRVLGMTQPVYARIAGSVTVWSRQPGVNPQTASRDVLMALPNVDAAAVDAYLAQRDQAIRDGLPVPAFAGAGGFASGAIQTWRIRAQARAPDGVTFVREAVVQPSRDPSRPLVVLAWIEGADAPSAPAGATTDNPDASRS